jgi:hypothetical protein
MKGFLRRTIYGLVPATLAVLVLGVPTATPDLGLNLQDVNLACNDGTDLALTLDAAAVAQLSDAVSAINLYPAGDPALACSLSQPKLLTSVSRKLSSASPSRRLAAGNPHYDYVVGGGQAPAGFFSPAGNFGVSVHAPDTPDDVASPTSGGTLNLTTPGVGSVVAKPDCLILFGGGLAEATGEVTHATGDYAAFEGSEVEVDFFDSGMPGGAGDSIDYEFEGGSPCAFDFDFPVSGPIIHGNINIHDADG